MKPRGTAPRTRALLLAALGLVCAAHGIAQPASPALDAWRAQAANVRLLAENDIPAAYQAALRLQAALPADATPADRAKALNVLTRVEVYRGDIAQAARHAEQALAVAKAADDRIGRVEADLNIALNAVNDGHIDRLREVTADSLQALQGVQNPQLTVEAMLRTSVTYRRFGQLEESVTMALQAMEVAQQSNDPLALAFAHQGLAISFSLSYRREEQLDHFRAMLREARAAPSRLLQASAMQGIGDYYTATGDLKEGERLFREAIALYTAAGTPLYMAHSLYALADNFMQQGRLPEAMTTLADTVAIYRHADNPIGLWYTLNLRSRARERLSDMKGAEEDAREAYQLARRVGFSPYVNGSAQRLAALQAAQGDYHRAYQYTQEAAAASEKAAQERASARMLELTERYQAEAQHRAIEELRHHNELQASQLKQQALQQRWLWTVLGAVLLALAGTAYFLLRLRRSSEAILQLNAGLEQRVQAATAELREQTSYLRTLIDTLPLMVWLKDADGRYLAVNQAMADACGRPLAQMTGRLDSEVWPASFVQAMHAHDAEVLQGQGRITTEAELPLPHGATWYEVYKAPVLDGEAVIGLVGAAHDVSVRKAAEQARELALAEARRLAQQRSEFLAQMSHELRTPLNGILGFAQILKRDKPLTERQERGLGIIEQSGQHLLALINDILDLARIDAAKLELQRTEVDLPGLLGVVSDIVRVKADEKHVLFVRQLDERLPQKVRVDEKRLRQVLLNLLSNAVKFTDRGEVSLAVSLLQRSGPLARIRFEVSDSGVGMNTQQLARLFQPFEQVGDARRREGGTGLGLAISRQLVRLMGGDIEVRSEPGRGSRFWFDIELPVVQQAEEARARPPGRPLGYEGLRRRILVADDVAQNRAVLVEGLAQLGFEVHEAGDGLQALEKAGALPPDLVLMDLTMPRLDGLEATRRLHALPGLAQVPVVAASGSPGGQAEEESRHAGMAAYLSKPIDQETLIDTVGRLLGVRWVYEGAAATSAAAEAQPWRPDGPPPPPAELDALYHWARMGNMRRVREQADALERVNPRHAALSRQLRQLAEGCQSRGLLELVEQLRQAAATPAE